MTYLLVTDIFFRKTFDVISVLRNEFPELELVIAVPSRNARDLRKARIIYKGICEVVMTDCQAHFDCDLQSLSDKHSEHEIVYLPIEEQTTLFFIDFVERHGRRNFTFLLPGKTTFETFRNKNLLNIYASERGFNAPASYDISQLRTIPAEAYPLLLKPAVGSGSKGLVRLYSPEDIDEAVLALLQSEPYVIQELIPDGDKVEGVFYLMDNGKTIGAYSHKRIRTSPPAGGVTVLSEICRNDDLLETGKQLLESAGWTGLVMLEYLFDGRTQTYKIIEANPRLWGSIMLSEYAGANLLKNYVRLSMRQNAIRPHIKSKAYIRWFFPVDILNYIKSGFTIKGFWRFKDTCFINWTYAEWYRAMLFNIILIFDVANIKKFIRR